MMFATGARLRAGASAFALIVFCSTQVSAQEADDSKRADGRPQRDVSDNTIVVTAQFREQDIQDTPLSISAIESEGIQNRGITQLAEVTNSVPNVVIKPSGSGFGPAAQVFIRGVGQYDSNVSVEPGVGMYIDDVYYGVLYGANFDLLDLERVEVLRGPQGTLAGKNSIGGSIKLFSQKPDGSGRSFVQAKYGARDLLDFRAGADLTLVPGELFARISGVTKSQEGFVQRLDYGCLNPSSGVPQLSTADDCKLGTEGGKNYTAGRIALRWLPSETIEINAWGSLLKDKSDLAPNVLLSADAPAPLFFGGFDPALFVTDPNGRISYSTYATNAFSDPPTYDGVPGAGEHPTILFPTQTDLTNWVAAGTVDWEASDNLKLKSITAYMETDASYSLDSDVTPVNVAQTHYNPRSEQFSQELRLSGISLADMLDWTVGLYYFRSENTLDGTGLIFAGQAGQAISSYDDNIVNISKSAFAHAVLHLGATNITGGLRYTDDSKTFTYGRLNPFMPNLSEYTAGGVINGLTSKYEKERLDYRIVLDHRWSDSFMTYAQVSTGYRGGGVNPRPIHPEQAVPFFPEVLTAYEAGFKTEFAERRMRLNGAVFLNDYDDIIFVNTAPTPNSVRNATPTNAGSAEIKGAELELSGEPIVGLLLDASVSYLDFDLKSVGGQGVVIAGVTTDTIAPFAPSWKVAVGIQYAMDIGGAGQIVPRLDYSYQSSFYTSADNDPRGEVSGYSLLNASLAWESFDQDWRVALNVSNVTDELYYQNKLFLFGLATAQPAAPREWSLSVRRNF